MNVSISDAENRDPKMTSVAEMESGGELKVESTPPLGSNGDDHPSTELVQKELEYSLPESSGDQDWVLSRKVSMLQVQVVHCGSSNFSHSLW